MWKSSVFWPVIIKNGELPPCVSRFVRFNPRYFSGNETRNQLFKGKKKFDFLAVLIESKTKVVKDKLKL